MLKKLCCPSSKRRVTVEHLNQQIVIDIQHTRDVDTKKGHCLCEALDLVFQLSRITGLLPIYTLPTRGGHKSGCTFQLSLGWLIYAYTILVLFVPYVLFTYIGRLGCGPGSTTLSNLEWYVMTYGYILTDIETIISLLIGVLYARSTCTFFEALSRIDADANEALTLRKLMSWNIRCILPVVLLVFISYGYVAYLRLDYTGGDFYCMLLDQPFAIVIRGLTFAFPAMETVIVIAITAIIVIKFEHLASLTAATLDACINYGQVSGFQRLAIIHRDIYSVLADMNKFFGIQLLMGITTSIYTIIYYLYRFCSVHNNDRNLSLINMHERGHYLLGLFCRASKLIIYMVLGSKITTNAKKPLKVLLENAFIVTLPGQLQQQVQTLILLWQHHKAQLSGLGVITIGPWLLAPIVGNVITYLLVAFQFQRTHLDLSPNVTAILESIF